MDRISSYFSGLSYHFNNEDGVVNKATQLFKNVFFNESNSCPSCRDFIVSRSPITLVPVFIISGVALAILIGVSIAIKRHFFPSDEKVKSEPETGKEKGDKELNLTGNEKVGEELDQLRKDANLRLETELTSNMNGNSTVRTLEVIGELKNNYKGDTTKAKRLSELEKLEFMINLNTGAIHPDTNYLLGLARDYKNPQSLSYDLEYAGQIYEFLHQTQNAEAQFELSKLYRIPNFIGKNNGKGNEKYADALLNFSIAGDHIPAMTEYINEHSFDDKKDKATTYLKKLIEIYTKQGNDEKVGEMNSFATGNGFILE